MKLTCVLMAFATVVVVADFPNISEDDFLKASERCFKREKLLSNYTSKFHRFEYPDEPAVHKFVHCVWTELALWNDRTGFNVEHIAELYKDKANTEILIPIISECNRNSRNEPPLKWCYRAFKCILDSRAGQWFKDDIVAKMQNGHQ